MNLSKKERDELREFILGMCPSNQRYVHRGALKCLDDLDAKDKEIEALKEEVEACEKFIEDHPLDIG